MNLLFASNLYPPAILGGYEILCDEVARRLAARGHRVHVLASTHPDGKTGTDEVAGVRVERALDLEVPFGMPYRFNPQRRWRAARHNGAAMRAALDRIKPDAAMMWSQLRLTTACAEATRDAGVPLVWAFNDGNILSYRLRPPRPTPWSFARWLLCGWILPGSNLSRLSFDWSTAISTTLRDELAAGGMATGRMRVIYQGIDPSRFPPREAPPCSANPMRVCYVGQVHPYKGVHTAIEAVGRFAARRGPDSITLSIIGAGEEDYVSALREQAEGSAAPVEFLGRRTRDELPDLYRRHDVLVFPSVWKEPFGLTHLEALASGLCVVTTLHGGQGEALVDGEHCLGFPPEDAAALDGALERLAAEPELAPRLARQGRDLVQRDLTLDAYAARIEQLLSDAVEGSR